MMKLKLVCFFFLTVLVLGTMCRERREREDTGRKSRRHRHRRVNRGHRDRGMPPSPDTSEQVADGASYGGLTTASSIVEIDAGEFQPEVVDGDDNNGNETKPAPTMSLQQHRTRLRRAGPGQSGCTGSQCPFSVGSRPPDLERDLGRLKLNGLFSRSTLRCPGQFVLFRDRQSRIFLIQTLILNRLGLKKQPNVTSKLPPETIDQLKERFIQMQLNGENQHTSTEEYYAKRFQAVPPSCQLPKGMSKVWNEPGLFHLYFDVSLPENSPDKETKVSSASIRLYKKPIMDCNCRRNNHRVEPSPSEDEDNEDDDLDDEEKVFISVWQYKNKKGKKRFLTTVPLNKTQEGWVKITVKSAVETWFKKRRRNLGLLLTVKDSKEHDIDPFEVFDSFNCSEFNSSVSRPFPLTMPEDMNEEDITIHDTLLLEANVTYPNLDILTIEAPKQKDNRESIRRKRDVSFKRGCFREKIYVSFAEFGWDQWVLQPQGFETGFCRGSCSPLVNSTYLHGKYLNDENKIMQQECCGPLLLKPLSLLQLNMRGELTIAVLDDFIVAECGCRP